MSTYTGTFNEERKMAKKRTDEQKARMAAASKAAWARRKSNGAGHAESYVRGQCRDLALAALEAGHVELAQAWARAGKSV